MIYTTYPSASFSIVRPVVHRHDPLLGQGVVALRSRFRQATLSRLENSLGWPSTGKLEWWSVVDLQLANVLGFKALDSCDWSCDAGSIDAIWHLEKLWVVRTMPLKVSRCWQFSQYVCPCHILQFTHPDIAVLKSCTCRCSAGRLAGRIRSFKAGWQMRVPLLEKRPLPTWIFESVDTFHARNVFWDSDCLLLVSQNFGTLA